MDRLIQQLQNAYRRYPKVAAYAVIGIFVAVLIGVSLAVMPNMKALAPAPSDLGTTSPRYTLEESTPTRIIIPKLQIDAPFEEPLGLEEDRTLETPKGYDTVAWYDGSPTPGELGPSVILGHVDSQSGPALFFYLGQLEVGDTFQIERADGSRPTFVVESFERPRQSEFPTERVYGPIDYAGVRLITCSGKYDRGALRYTHNLVVYARLVDTRSAEVVSSTPTE